MEVMEGDIFDMATMDLSRIHTFLLKKTHFCEGSLHFYIKSVSNIRCVSAHERAFRMVDYNEQL